MIAALRREGRRFVNRCVWSWAGWREAWAQEPSLRRWSAIVALSSLLALVLPLEFAERTMILPFGVLLLAMEVINTAIDARRTTSRPTATIWPGEPKTRPLPPWLSPPSRAV